jgi:hypothetical protein
LIESVSSCIFFSQVLSCLTNSSSHFPFIIISSWSLGDSVFSLFYSAISISVSFFFLRFSILWVTFSLILSIFSLNLFISLFLVFSVSVWYLFRVPKISFICCCVFSCSLILLSWNFLSASYMFWLTTSSNISMKFSLITCRISSFRTFLWASLGSLV